ncbi:beta-alanyl-bioamine nonribosomal peptide synthetase ebony-like [Glandiceps talaboti]
MDGFRDFRLLYNAYTPGRKFVFSRSNRKNMSHIDSKDLDSVSILQGPKVPFPYGLPADTVHRVLEHLVKHDESTSEKTALIYEGKKTTYGELNRQASALARVIKDRLKISNQGDHGPVCIGLHLDPSDTIIKLVFAVLKLGAAYLPLDPAYPLKRLQYTISNSTPCCVITANKESQLVEMVSDLPEADRPMVLMVDDLLINMEAFPDNDLDESEQIINGRVDSSTLACILYTSGSTGLPKGVRLLHRSIVHRSSGLWSSFPITEADVSCWQSSLCFVDSVTEIFGFLLRGLTVVIASADKAINPEKMIAILDENKVTWMLLVPTLLHTILTVLKKRSDEERKNSLQSVQTFACAGEELSPRLARDFVALLPKSKLANIWGMTETGGDVTYFFLENDQMGKKKQVSIGVPIQNTNIYLLDDNMMPVPIGETGTCYVSGPNISDGYLVAAGKSGNTSRATDQKESFTSNPFDLNDEHNTLFNTGDYMRLVRDKTTNELQLMFEGRRDTLVKYHGFRIDLSEIESAMSDIPYFERVVVLFHQKRRDDDQTLVAYYKTLDDVPDCTSDSVIKYLGSVLPDYMIPKVVCVDEFPTLPNGKTNNDTLKQSISTKSLNGSYATSSEESSPHACVIRDAVGRTLDVPFKDISLMHNFFQIGGNSMNAIEAIMRIRENGLELDIEDFFSSKTLGDLLKITLTESKQAKKPFIVDEDVSVPGYQIVLVNEATDEEFEIGCLMGAEGFACSEPATRALEIPLEVKIEAFFSGIKSLAKENADISFFVRRQSDNKIVAVCVNRDMYDYVNHDLDAIKDFQMRVLFTKWSEIDRLLIETLDVREPKQWCFMNLTAVDEEEDVSMKASLQKLLEIEKIKVARCYGFRGCCGSYSNPVSIAMAREVGHVEEASSGYIRDYEYDGKKYFAKIQPPDTKIRVMARYL